MTKRNRHAATSENEFSEKNIWPNSQIMTYITLNTGKLEPFTGVSVCVDGQRNYGNEHYATMGYAGDIDGRAGFGVADG